MVPPKLLSHQRRCPSVSPRMGASQQPRRPQLPNHAVADTDISTRCGATASPVLICPTKPSVKKAAFNSSPSVLVDAGIKEEMLSTLTASMNKDICSSVQSRKQKSFSLSGRMELMTAAWKAGVRRSVTWPWKQKTWKAAMRLARTLEILTQVLLAIGQRGRVRGLLGRGGFCTIYIAVIMAETF